MKKIFLFMLMISLFSTSGCVYRKLTIKSNPPDATVYFNDKEMGETPVEFDFMYYATHKIRLEKDGYESLVASELIKCPPHLWIPFDLFADLIPVRIDDYREFSYDLVPRTPEEGLAE